LHARRRSQRASPCAGAEHGPGAPYAAIPALSPWSPRCDVPGAYGSSARWFPGDPGAGRARFGPRHIASPIFASRANQSRDAARRLARLAQGRVRRCHRAVPRAKRWKSLYVRPSHTSSAASRTSVAMPRTLRGSRMSAGKEAFYLEGPGLSWSSRPRLAVCSCTPPVSTPLK